MTGSGMILRCVQVLISIKLSAVRTSTDGTIETFLFAEHWRRMVDSNSCWEDISARVPKGFCVTSSQAQGLFQSLDSSCRNCLTPLSLAESDDSLFANNVTLARRVWSCSDCRWWYLRSETCQEFDEDSYHRTTDYYESIAARFRLDAKNTPLETVREHLRDNATDIGGIHPTTFEHLLRDVYADFYPGANVTHVGGPGDGGIDLWAVIDDEPCLVQAKRRRSDGHVESVVGVRELVGTLALAGLRKGHLVTTAPRFSKAAKRVAAEAASTRYGFLIELKKRDDISKMLRLTTRRKQRPWVNYSAESDSDLASGVLPVSHYASGGPVLEDAAIGGTEAEDKPS